MEASIAEMKARQYKTIKMVSEVLRELIPAIFLEIFFSIVT